MIPMWAAGWSRTIQSPQLWPMAPKEGVWGGKSVVIGLNHYRNFSANNVEEQNSGDIHMVGWVEAHGMVW